MYQFHGTVESFNTPLEGFGKYYRATITTDDDRWPDEYVGDARTVGEAFEAAFAQVGMHLLDDAESARPEPDPEAAPKKRRRRRSTAKGKSVSGADARSLVMDAARKDPGTTVADIVKATGVRADTFYRAVTRLVEQGEITREGRGLYPLPEAPDPAVNGRGADADLVAGGVGA